LVSAGAVAKYSLRCQLQFAKASAATLPQQKMNESADVQQEE
jgi:hypothetical protein